MKDFFIRLLNTIIGLFLYALGIVITIKANIGYSPWDVFHAGFAKTTGLSFGLSSIIVGAIIVALVTISGEKLGIGTLASMILTGVFIDTIMIFDIPQASGSLVSGTIMMISGLFIIAIGSYFYMKSAFGIGPRDNLMVVLARKTGLPVGLCRFAIELLVTTAGWILGGMAGAGTVIAVIAVGFCVQITFRLLKFDVTAVKHETLSETFARFYSRKKHDL